jgi:hypothetical protein
VSLESTECVGLRGREATLLDDSLSGESFVGDKDRFRSTSQHHRLEAHGSTSPSFLSRFSLRNNFLPHYPGSCRVYLFQSLCPLIVVCIDWST